MPDHHSSPADGDPIFERDVYTVSRLNREARGMLEAGFPLLWIEGEISNLARPSSGHIYFSLKDDAAQVRCAMFRQWNIRLGFAPADGQRVLVRARVSLYEARGEFQLIVEFMEEAGEGALRRAFEALKCKLEAEGLFRPEYKRPLPELPRRIGVITSPSGAAVRDIINVLRRRFPAIPVRIYPTAVQGASAPGEIVAALQLASDREDCEVLILARGGGSLEDLMAFNDESVARAVHACEIPVVCGVGHEIDFTIADFVADARAPTPSAAAELVVPDQREWLRSLDELLTRSARAVAGAIEDIGESMQWLTRRLSRLHPGKWLRQQQQRLDELDARLNQAGAIAVERNSARLATLFAKLMSQKPTHDVKVFRSRCDTLVSRLVAEVRRRLGDQSHRVGLAARGLESVSPQATLDRGYAIVTAAKSGDVLTDVAKVTTGDQVSTRLARGAFTAEILKTRS